MNELKFECIDQGFGRIYVGLKTATARFHFWLNATKDGPEQDTIYKNALVDHKTPGWFNTRYLEARNATNAPTVKLALASIDIEKAIRDRAEADAAEARKHAAEAAARKRSEELAKAAPDMLQSLIDLLAMHDGQHPWTMQEQSDKLKAARALVAKGIS